MNHIQPKNQCILTIALSTRGFGFVVLEGREMLVDWGVKTVEGNKNLQSLAQVRRLIAQYQPKTLVLEDVSVKGSRRAPRIRALTRQIVKIAPTLKVCVKLFSRHHMLKAFFTDGKGTKHLLAELMAKRFPEQLGRQLPPKRKPWQSEDPRMSIFVAAALAAMFHGGNVETDQLDANANPLESRRI